MMVQQRPGTPNDALYKPMGIEYSQTSILAASLPSSGGAQCTIWGIRYTAERENYELSASRDG